MRQSRSFVSVGMLLCFSASLLTLSQTGCGKKPGEVNALPGDAANQNPPGKSSPPPANGAKTPEEAFELLAAAYKAQDGNAVLEQTCGSLLLTLEIAQLADELYKTIAEKNGQPLKNNDGSTRNETFSEIMARSRNVRYEIKDRSPIDDSRVEFIVREFNTHGKNGEIKECPMYAIKHPTGWKIDSPLEFKYGRKADADNIKRYYAVPAGYSARQYKKMLFVKTIFPDLILKIRDGRIGPIHTSGDLILVLERLFKEADGEQESDKE